MCTYNIEQACKHTLELPNYVNWVIQVEESENNDVIGNPTGACLCQGRKELNFYTVCFDFQIYKAL